MLLNYVHVNFACQKLSIIFDEWSEVIDRDVTEAADREDLRGSVWVCYNLGELWLVP